MAAVPLLLRMMEAEDASQENLQRLAALHAHLSDRLGPAVLEQALLRGLVGGSVSGQARHALGHKGMVSAGSPFGAAAGCAVLAAGGTAADAAVATAFAMAVADPANMGLMGRCHVLSVSAEGRALAWIASSRCSSQ